MVVFYKQVVLPEYCLLSCAIEWLSLGRVPELQIQEDGDLENSIEWWQDWRNMPDSFNAVPFKYFEDEEFAFLGLEMDPDYPDAAYKCFSESIEKLPERIEEYSQKKPSYLNDDAGPNAGENIWSVLAANDQKNYDKHIPLKKIVDREELKFQRFIDIAWARLFSKIAQGELLVEGVNYNEWERLSQDDENLEIAGKFQTIDPSYFSLSYPDWRKNALTLVDNEFFLLRIKTDSIVCLAHKMISSLQSTTAKRYGSYLCVEGQPQINSRKLKGRIKKAVDWNKVREFIMHQFSEKKLPEYKEGCIYETIIFIEKTFKKEVSRSTVQRYLKVELAQIYAQK